MGSQTTGAGPRPFFPNVDVAVLSSKKEVLPTYPRTVGPVFDPDQATVPLGPWSSGVEAFYPAKVNAYAPASVPEQPPSCLADRYLRASLAENERLRLFMLWYYTRDILQESELLAGFQEKAYLAQESTGWEYVVIGILDVNFYIRLSTVGLPLGILPRGETLCAHTVTQPPASVFLLPNMMEDWRFKDSPYVESGGLLAYAGAPLRLQNEYGETVCLGSLCVASSTSEEPLTRPQQNTLIRLADWIVADIVQCARAGRQRERRRMTEAVASAQKEAELTDSEEPILEILRTTYPNALVNIYSSKATEIELDGRDPISPSDLDGGLWEDTQFFDDFIANSNHKDFPSTRVVRIVAAKCETISGPSLLSVASKDFRLIFDDVDHWFVQTCATLLSQIWHKRLLGEVMRAKDKFIRGVSHQLRTPIHGILGSAELLAEELSLLSLREGAQSISIPPEATKAARSGEHSVYLNTIRTAGRDLISIVNSMITLNRWADIALTDRQSNVHTVYELETKLTNEIQKVTSGDTRYRASLLFNYNIPSNLNSLRTDLGLLQDCVLPLVLNAVHNTTEGVVVVTFSILPDTKEFVIDVVDNGCGIAPDDHNRIFEPYEKVDPYSTGAGLGLTLASKFTALLHGSVALISSDVDRGSHFRITLAHADFLFIPSPMELLSTKLGHLPSKFHVLAAGSGNMTLSDSFTNSLACHGFTASDSIDDCLVIFESVPELEKHQKLLDQIPPGQVAICLVSEQQYPKQPSGNIVYMGQPFLTSTLNSALEEADKALEKIKASKAQPIVSDENSAMRAVRDMIDETSKAAQEITPSINGLDSKALAEPTETYEHAAMHNIAALTLSPDSLAQRPCLRALASYSKPTALLVDDNAVNLRIMQMYCKKRGLEYFSAVDGKQAVDIFSQHQSLAAAGEGSGIQLILMDLQMPVCDGIEATRQIRSLEKQNSWVQSALFIVTGQDGPTDQIAANDAGADNYFVKPLGIKILDRVVQQYFPDFKSS